MRIDRILLLGIVSMAILTVFVTATLLIRDMLHIAQAGLGELNSVAASVKEQNEEMFANLNRQASEVGADITGINERAAIEQLRYVGDGISKEIKAVMDAPFAMVQAFATTLLFKKTESERRTELPCREWVERYMVDFLSRHDNLHALFCAWEKNAFDGKDAEFIGMENEDDDMIRENPDYVSEGAFIPWFYKKGNDRIVRAFLDDYLVSDVDYYIEPRDTKREFISEPYAEEDVIITSFCVPIIQDGIVLGVAGIDVTLQKLKDIVEERQPFETGFAMFFSPEGAIVYYPDEKVNYTTRRNGFGDLEKVYHNIDEFPELQRIQEAESGFGTSTALPGREGEEMLFICIPVQFGDYPAKWTVVVAAPANKVMEHRDRAQQGMAGMVAGIETQNQTFVDKLDSQVTNAVRSAKTLESSALWRSLRIGLYVLIVSTGIGWFFAGWVHRSIAAENFWYRQILDAANDPISVVDIDSKVMFVNKAGLALLCKPLADCVGKSIDDVWKSTIGKDYAASGIRLLKSDGRTFSHIEFNGADWDVTSNYIVDVSNRKSGMIEIFKDVSDRANIYRLVEQVDGVIQSTVQQTANIAQAASDLSTGSTQQAESVESITADMKAVNEQTQNNAENADQANRLSDEAGRAATLGQGRMQAMVTSMNQISENARNTRTVIKTIDDIAFQTNLLALNAAVEAARAGTHGKGFAVVAEEVRNLAARSAKAAKETEELIVKSNQQIDGGVAVADQTAEALNAIAGFVTEISALIQQIAGTSKEQTGGVHRMTGTLRTIDQVTQQNVDLSSTTANAAQLLASEVRNLQELMKKLRKNGA